MPCTTPASQLGLLHGTVDGVPAFRWYDREAERLVVANRPPDAALIESRASNGRGLLADDGVSVSNLFTGDAARSAMTMSRLSASRGSPQTRRAVAWFLARPDGFARSFSRTLAEVVRERYQSARQRRRDVRPRVHRGWTFALLRAVSNGVLRDLNTAVVCDEMLRGTRAVYVDYVDYDEIAHHAGMFRPESLTALEALDGVLAVLDRVRQVAPRRYWIVALSDHGQSQGAAFEDAQGIDLSSLVRLPDGRVGRLGRGVRGELGAGRVRCWTTSTTRGRGADDGAGAGRGNLLGPVARKVRDHGDAAPVTADTGLVVLGSGNLGLVYVPGTRRLTREEIDQRWPRLVPGLVAQPGIAFVAGPERHRPGGGRGVGHPLPRRRAWSRAWTRWRRSPRTRRRTCAGPSPWTARPTSTSTATSTRRASR